VSTARDAAAQIAAVPGADDDLAFTYATLDLTYALAEIEHLDTLTMGTTPILDSATGVDLGRVANRTINGLLVAAQLAVAEVGSAAGAAPSAVLPSPSPSPSGRNQYAPGGDFTLEVLDHGF
jgi:hypothetical protein